VTHILGHIAMQREAALTRGEKNRVMLKLYLMARQNPLPDVWKVGAVPMKDHRPGDRVRARASGSALQDPPNVVTLRIAGKDVAITINEHNPQALRMAQALKNLDVDDSALHGPGVGIQGTRWFASCEHAVQPDLRPVINLMRDIQGAALNLSTTELAGKQGKFSRSSCHAGRCVLKNKGRNADNRPGPRSWKTSTLGGTTGYRDLYLTQRIAPRRWKRN
jgi:hypothetical protein